MSGRPAALFEHSFESFNDLVEEIISLGFDEQTASYYASLVGDTPIRSPEGTVIVVDEKGMELARLKLKMFQ